MACDLTRRNGRNTLPASSTEVQLLTAEGPTFEWRTLDLWSGGGRPFEAEVEFSGGGGAGAPLTLTVARAARVSFPAKRLTVKARNLGSVSHEVYALVCDGGPCPGRNVLERTESVSSGSPVTLEVPAYAQRLHLGVGLGSLASCTLSVLDATGGLTEVVAADALPDGWLELGGAHLVSLSTTDPTVLYRAVFALAF